MNESKYDAVRRAIFPLVAKVARSIDLFHDNSVHKRLAMKMIQSSMMGELLGVVSSRSTFEDDRFLVKHNPKFTHLAVRPGLNSCKEGSGQLREPVMGTSHRWIPELKFQGRVGEGGEGVFRGSRTNSYCRDPGRDCPIRKKESGRIESFCSGLRTTANFAPSAKSIPATRLPSG